MIFDEEQDAHKNDNSISNSMLLEIEYRTQNVKGNIEREFGQTLKQQKVMSSRNMPQIEFNQLYDKDEKDIYTELNLMNQTASQNSNTNRNTLEMNHNPLTQRIPAESEYNRTEHNSQVAVGQR